MPGSKDYLDKNGSRGRNVFGVRSRLMGTGRGDLMFLDYVAADMPELSGICEFGTWGGYTSLYLGMIARLRGVRLCTFDIADFRPPDVVKAWDGRHMSFYAKDLLGKPDTKVRLVIGNPNTLLFVDNGNKKMEANTYARFCGIGTRMVIHDWNTEVCHDDVWEQLSACGFEPVYADTASSLSASCACYVKSR